MDNVSTGSHPQLVALSTPVAPQSSFGSGSPNVVDDQIVLIELHHLIRTSMLSSKSLSNQCTMEVNPLRWPCWRLHFWGRYHPLEMEVVMDGWMLYAYISINTVVQVMLVLKRLFPILRCLDSGLSALHLLWTTCKNQTCLTTTYSWSCYDLSVIIYLCLLKLLSTFINH